MVERAFDFTAIRLYHYLSVALHVWLFGSQPVTRVQSHQIAAPARIDCSLASIRLTQT